MLVRITKGGKFAHPDPAKYGQTLYAVTDEVLELDDEQGKVLVSINRAVKVTKREYEIAHPQIIEEPEDPEEIEVTDESKTQAGCAPCKEKKKRGRPPGRKRTV
jgi:hypothetical protein